MKIKEFLDFAYNNNYTNSDSEITLIYEGEITHQIMKAFTSMTEISLEKQEETSSVSKKLFHVMVECLQNISKHADVENINIPDIKRGIFLISRSNENYCVITGNYLDNSRKEELKKILEKINTLDKEELKELYKDQMKNASLSDKGGAGLGFIDIARKTNEKLKYDFVEIKDNSVFFILKSTISRTI